MKQKIEEEPKTYGNPKFYKKWANHPNRQFLVRLFAFLDDDLVLQKTVLRKETDAGETMKK